MNDFNRRVLALIPARGGSKRLPEKNILPCGGRPLISHSISAAQAVRPPLGRIAVSTDSEEIAAVGRSWGAEVPFIRPAALATDAAASIDVIVHALDWFRQDGGFDAEWVLLLQPTSPLRKTSDIEAALSIAADSDCDSVIGVTPIRQGHPSQARRIVRGRLEYFMQDLQQRDVAAADAAYAINGALYLSRAETMRRDGSIYGKRSVPYLMPPERSVDIDTEFDLRIASALLADRRDDA